MEWHRRFPGDAAEWHRDLVASTLALAGDEVAMVVVDPLGGAVAVATPAAEALLGGPFPERVADLVERGTVARPDLDAIAHHLAAWRALDQIEGAGRESSHAWSVPLRAHVASGSRDLVLDVLHHRRPLIGAEAVVVTVRSAGEEDLAEAPVAVGAPDRFWLVYDHQMRIIAADPRMARLGIDPKAHVGLLGALTVHPEDVPGIVPLVVAVINEQAEAAHYVTRIRGEHGWVRVQAELRRMLAPDGPVLVGSIRPAPQTRRTLPPDLLTPREAAIVDALFDGLRVAAIAERDGVSVKTIRNQLAGTYRKLEVGGQEELLRSFTRPSR